ncbi:NACHT domain-containing protein [Streptomyces sp. NPDC093510]|uniref:NACHT domain-containing protein n=1 Tax=Streptomyces sp. NPDC093510 TaxID=3155199 RepID=UPI003445C3F3
MAGLWWTVDALPQAQGDSDPAGLLAVLPGLVGAVLAGWGVWAGVRALRAQRTASVIAEEFARSVVRAEGAQYRQMLGSGLAAPDGRIDLAFTARATGVSGTQPDGTLEEIADYYRGLRPGRMVITGTPAAGPDGQAGGDAGTGKTVLALTLILGLAKDRAPHEPVPVRLTAASWPGSGVRDWLRAHLTDAYRLAPREAARLVDADLVLPVIDGLDEMDTGTAPGYTSRAAALLRCIEQFETGGTHCPVVLTCRHAHYQALVDAETEPRIVARLALARVDASRAHRYLRQRVAGTERGRARWRPVLSALAAVAAAGPAGTVQPEHARLAGMLDTPWRLTLAATVFEERTTDGRYLRDPADLLALATGGHLYEYLLDRYIGAAVAAPHRGTDDIPRPSGTDSRPRLDADATWRRLAVLARYLNGNAGTEGGPPRSVAGRTLSSTDLALHELWPLAGTHRTRWTERILAAALLFPALYLALPQADIHIPAAMCALLVCLAVMYRPAWPKPRRIDLGRLRTHAGRRALTLGFAMGFVIGFVITFVLFVTLSYSEDTLDEGLVVGLMFGLTFGPVFGLARGLMTKKEGAGVAPRDLIRMDLTAGVVFGPVTGLGSGLVLVLVGTLAYGFAYGLGPREPAALMLCALGFAIGAFVFCIPAAGGLAALRYFALLLHTRKKLTWRLGRFLDACYQLGILRVAGTAWQFRHRELQDHLATRPLPPPRP